MAQPLDIAIIGFGGVFPGAADLAEFWTNIEGGVDASAEVPASRWALDPNTAFAPEIGAPDHVCSRRACLIQGPVEVDGAGLSIDPERLRGLDPMFLLAVRAAQIALADVGPERLDRDRTGVIFGNIVLPTDPFD